MPEDVVVPVAKVDQVGTGHASLFEGNVIVSDLVGAAEKVRLVPQSSRGFIYDAFEPGSGIQIAIDIEIGISDHIRKQERFDFFERSVGLPLLRQMADAVQAVAVKR